MIFQSSPPAAAIVASSLIEVDTFSADCIERSNTNGFCVRKLITDPSQTSAEFAEEIVHSHIPYLYELCNDLVGGSNCDITVSYGNGNKTKVMVRYEGKEGEDVVNGNVLLVVKMFEGGRASLLATHGERISITICFAY